MPPNRKLDLLLIGIILVVLALVVGLVIWLGWGI